MYVANLSFTLCIFIDASARNKYISADFYLDLPVTLKNVLSMRMESFEINNTIYNISSARKTNKMYVKKNKK